MRVAVIKPQWRQLWVGSQKVTIKVGRKHEPPIDGICRVHEQKPGLPGYTVGQRCAGFTANLSFKTMVTTSFPVGVSRCLLCGHCRYNFPGGYAFIVLGKVQALGRSMALCRIGPRTAARKWMSCSGNGVLRHGGP